MGFGKREWPLSLQYFANRTALRGSARGADRVELLSEQRDITAQSPTCDACVHSSKCTLRTVAHGCGVVHFSAFRCKQGPHPRSMHREFVG